MERDTRELMETRRLRGRPPTLLPVQLEYLAGLIRQHRIAGAQRLAEVSNSDSTLVKIARESGMELPKGRRTKRAA